MGGEGNHQIPTTLKEQEMPQAPNYDVLPLHLILKAGLTMLFNLMDSHYFKFCKYKGEFIDIYIQYQLKYA